jgi:hypothetical protein
VAAQVVRTAGTARGWAGTLALLALLAAIHTWPLASDPATLSRNDNGDTQLNEWILAWIAHQLPRAPLRLFEAKIFFPEPRALAFSEPLLVPALLGTPIRWAGASPVLTYNLLLLAGFVVTGLAAFHVAVAWTGDRLAGLMAGSLLAFNALTLSRLPHLQAHWAPFLPLALLALERVMSTGGGRAAVALGACVALLTVTSGYWAALVVVALALAFVVRTGAWWPRRRLVLGRLALAAALAVTLAAPILVPYWRAHREQGLTRSADEAASFASTPASYLSTPARLHHAAWSHRFYGSRGGSYFPGLVGLGLAVVALAARGAWGDARRRTLALVGTAGLLLSLGPATPLYPALHAVFPPMRGLRDPSRFGHLVLLAVALLAAFGLRALRERLPGRRGTLAAVLLLALANAEALCAPIGYVPFEGFSPVYARLAREAPRTALAEFPLHPPDRIYLNAGYVLASTVHWTPLVNGYSGFTPPAFVERAQTLRHFPDEAAIALLRELRVSHVVVHLGRYRSPRRERIEALLASRADFELLETGPDGERLYRLREAG